MTDGRADGRGRARSIIQEEEKRRVMRFSSSTWLRTRTYIDACMPFVMAWPTAPPVRCRYAARQSHPAVTKKVRTNLFSGFRSPSLPSSSLAGRLAGFPATIWHAEQQRRNVVVVRGGGREEGRTELGNKKREPHHVFLGTRPRSEGGREKRQSTSFLHFHRALHLLELRRRRRRQRRRRRCWRIHRLPKDGRKEGATRQGMDESTGPKKLAFARKRRQHMIYLSGRVQWQT